MNRRFVQVEPAAVGTPGHVAVVVAAALVAWIWLRDRQLAMLAGLCATALFPLVRGVFASLVLPSDVGAAVDAACDFARRTELAPVQSVAVRHVDPGFFVIAVRLRTLATPTVRRYYRVDRTDGAVALEPTFDWYPHRHA